MAYVHAHRHGEFSRLDGCGTADLYAAEAARLGQGVLGLTDHGTLSGALHHIEACKAQKILPIVGVEAYYRPNRVVAKRFKQREAWHLCLYAKNLTGWHSLLRLVSAAFQEVHDGGGFYQYPCIDAELLQRHRAGLVASSACVNSYLAKLIANGDHVLVNEYIDQMLSLFGDDFWLEVMPHDFEDQRYLNQILVDIARERSIGLLATNDAHFPLKEWAETHRVAKLCGSASSFEKARKDKEKGKADYLADLNPHLYLASEAEMRQWFADYHPMIPSFTVDEAIENTQVFASRFVPFLLDRSLKLPRAAEQEERAVQESTEQILERWIREGWERLSETYPEAHWEKWPKPIYEARLAHEWEILQSKGVIDYFVLVGDVVRWAKARGIRVGLGRGSAAGCLISYLIGITAIDPISWGLLFERFLNPERKGLPDIDLDFQSDRRHEVKEYVSSKRWCEACGADHDGSAHVADIITHARFQPKSVLQAIGRTFDLPYPEMLALTDTIEIRADSEETTLEELLPLNEKLRDWKSAYPELWPHCLRLEGTVQNAGKHAAGIIITPKPVVEYMALERGKKGDLVTSWSDSADFQAISDYGFVKIDCLGITGLAKHAYTCSLIRKRYEIDLDLNALAPLRDPTDAEEPVLDGFRQGHTVGVFQFGGHAITALVREINPDSTLDLSATNALYRPGPINSGVHRSYAKRKHDPTQVSYWSELVQPVLAETYGLVAYQEQVMEITKQLGGFSGAEADDMRKAMGKLYRIKGGRAAKDFMAQYEQKWFAGCSSRGIAKKTADEIWEKILEFGHYGFNKTVKYSSVVERYTTNQHDPDPNITLQEIWERFYGSKRSTPVGMKYRHRGLWIRGYDQHTGRITKKKVVDIHDHGVLPLYEITLENGLSISASEQHRHMTPGGWRTVGQLRVGDQLVFDTKAQDATRASAYRQIMTPGIGKDWISKTETRILSDDGVVRPAIHGHHAALSAVTALLPDHCEICGSDEGRLERAHLDGDRTNNTRENVKRLCNSCHKTHDGHLRGGPWSRGSISASSQIVSIEYDGEHRAYDLEVEGETEMDHNYVANGIVTHNSHSASYALQAYQDMWLKTHYPLEFYAAFLTYEDDSERVLAAIREAKARKIPILAPSVQTSGIGWMPDADGLRMSLVAIKGVGAKGAAEIIKQRAYGPFADLDDLRQRIPARALNAKAFEALRECGALDCFDARADYSDLEKAAAEKHLLGMTFTSLPELERHADTIRANIYSQDECRQYGPGTSVIVGGEIHRIDKKQTKRGSTYATITLIFELNEWRVRFWKEALIEYDHMLKIGNMIMVTGKTDEWNGNMSVVARDVTDQFDGLWEENGGRN